MENNSSETIVLVQRARAGNAQAVNAIFTRHRDRLRRMVEIRLDSRLHARIDASDVIQDAYLEVAQRWEEYLRNPKLPLFLWLRLVVGERLTTLHRQHFGTRMRDARLARLKQLRDDKEVLEEQLARASKPFRNLRRPPPSLEQLQKALPQGTALIDLGVYRSTVPPAKRKDKNKEEHLNHLVAFIVRPDQDVQMIFVDDLQTLERLIESWRQAVSANNTVLQAEAARQIHQRLWQPLQKHLGVVDTVLISADGPLLRFPFAALPGKKPNTFLLEDLAIG